MTEKQQSAVPLTYDQQAMVEMVKVLLAQIRTNKLVGLVVIGLTPEGKIIGEHLLSPDFVYTMRGLVNEADDRLRERYGDRRRQAAAPEGTAGEEKPRLYDPTGATLE